MEGVFTSSFAATAWRIRENGPCGYDCASASPDFANGAITGAFAYAAGSLAEEGGQAANDNTSSSNETAEQDMCHYSVSCMYGSSTANAQGTQVAEAACLYTASQCNDIGPPTTRQEAIQRLEYMGGYAAFVGGGAVVDSLGGINTLRALFEGWGAYANPEELPEITPAPPPELPAIIEPYNPPPPPKLPPNVKPPGG